jgi:cold shock CspA family protein
MLFGKIQHFDETSGGGTIKPENGNSALSFEKSAVSWGDATTPKVDRRLSYEVGQNDKGADCAIKLQPA